ncbi:histidinol-phosphate transaminase [Desulfatitalea alkaliphila]|uniref:Histidinol-phosphate aminotransferase n=1 Tax=Desulfatitalea alkaliphila TaxID=2929485 RepID=A0AA41QZN6_9BACT|nr:histidinol-phosphate transaminase [Desulfatitalea alkaliphila]MCJ8499179.1 histidinol-phosphate transaminase [Desulfatitalea alkaliphila]
MNPYPAMLVPPAIRTIDPYMPSKPDRHLMAAYGIDTLYRLNNNENPLGPPPGAAAAISGLRPERMAIYPSGDAYDLRGHIAKFLDVSPDQVVCGNGANEIIQFVISAYCGPGDNIVTGDKTFAVYEWVAEFSGVEARLTPMKDHGFDPDAMLAFMDGRTKILFVCNPNNPTGTYWNGQTLEAFLRAVDGRAMVVVDEAYCEFVDRPDFPDAATLLDRYPNLLVFRTFSKVYGLAGLRIGYLVGHRDAVYDVCRTRIVYSINAAAQAAAMAALGDTDHIHRTREMVADAKCYLTGALKGLGLPVIAGEGNYVIGGLPFNDQLAYRRLIRRGYMVRTMTSFRFPNHIRITLRRRPVMEGFVAALAAVLEKIT